MRMHRAAAHGIIKGVELSRARRRPDEHLPNQDPASHRRFQGGTTGRQHRADLANATNSELHLLTVARGNPDPVYHIYEGSLRYETYQQALETIKGEAQKVLDEQVQKVEEAGGSVKEAYLRIGERRDQAIVHLAEELSAGLIVMGSRGLGG